MERQAAQVTTEEHRPHDDPDGLELDGALIALRDVLASARYPLGVPGAADAERAAREFAGQLTDYVLPRLRHPQAPLLVVVGGSTGGGKSTLVNSMVRASVSPAGVLRPTTRSPVLVCNPRDVDWFTGPGVLPSFARGTLAEAVADEGHHTLRIVPSELMRSGLAFLDAPDVDSVVGANREIAAQLLAAADLWLFVTTAARYADALPWQLLATAHQRGLSAAIVLNRVAPSAEQTVARDLRDRLAAAGLTEPTLFVLPEVQLEAGLLPEPTVASIQVWATGLAGSRDRAAVAQRTVDGVLTSVGPRIGALAAAADAQLAAAEQLIAGLRAGYASAAAKVHDEIGTGALLRGEVLARWQEFVGSGEFGRTLSGQVGRLRNRIAGYFTTAPPRDVELKIALESGLAQLVTSAAEQAAEDVADAWRPYPAGATVLDAAGSGLGHSSPQLGSEVERLVREWQVSLLAGVQNDLSLGPTTAQVSSGAFATALVVTVAALAGSAGLPGGVEVEVAGGTDRLLEGTPIDVDAVWKIAAEARADLIHRIDALLNTEETRFVHAIDGLGLDLTLASRLREAEKSEQFARDAAMPVTAALIEDPAPRPEPGEGTVPAWDAATEPPAGEPPADPGTGPRPSPGAAPVTPEPAPAGRDKTPNSAARTTEPAPVPTKEEEPPGRRVRRTVGRPRTTDSDDGDHSAKATAPAQRGEPVAVQLARAAVAGGPAGLPDPHPVPPPTARSLPGHSPESAPHLGEDHSTGNEKSTTSSSGRRRRATADQGAAATPRPAAEIGDEEAAG
jgi:hypothetical protein